MTGLPGVAFAQVIEHPTPWQMPRPGYEPHLIHLGPLTLGPQFQINETYDSNIYASHRDVQGDFVTSIAPSLSLHAEHDKLALDSRLWATQTQYAQHSRETNTTFGAGAQGVYSISRANTLSVDLNYAHLTESRADPESTRTRNQSPAEYNTGSAGFSYVYQHNRVALTAKSMIRRVDYATNGEQDQDRTDYDGALRGAYILSPRFNVFLEAFTERRNFDTARDRTGLDRDALTTGFYVGTGINFAHKLWGEIGVGMFHVANDDSSLKSFIGVGARGSLTWSITPRTALTASLRREDAATVVPGATGRVETQFGLELEQEVRHNFLLKVNASLLHEGYQGTDKPLTTPSGQITAQYLLNNRMSLVSSVGYTNRFAGNTIDRYNRFFVTVGISFAL